MHGFGDDIACGSERAPQVEQVQHLLVPTELSKALSRIARSLLGSGSEVASSSFVV